MLDLPGLPVLDKTRLIGGCLRLPVSVDAARLRGEIEALPPQLWEGTGGRVGVHRVAQAVFLRGFAPAEGEKPIEDRPPLALLPYARLLITEVIGTKPLRCLLARLSAGAVITPHIDLAPYFSKALRVHVPVTTSEQAWMYSSGLSYRMKPGEVWVLNNSDLHGVWNASADQARIHVICDFVPTPALLELMARGERNLGTDEPAVRARMAAGAQAR
jgi:hypothetical protein